MDTFTLCRIKFKHYKSESLFNFTVHVGNPFKIHKSPKVIFFNIKHTANTAGVNYYFDMLGVYLGMSYEDVHLTYDYPTSKY